MRQEFNDFSMKLGVYIYQELILVTLLYDSKKEKYYLQYRINS